MQWQDWRNATDSIGYECGWCDRTVSSPNGMYALNSQGQGSAALRICPHCGGPTTILADDGLQVPGAAYGDNVADLPNGLAALYREARECVGVGAHHAAVMVGRKILMHVAVEQGAEAGKSFASYVDYLVSKNLVPPNSRDWVDEIREVANDANHEIAPIAADEARSVVDFTSMLLKLLYEYPARGQRSVASRAARDAQAEPGS